MADDDLAKPTLMHVGKRINVASETGRMEIIIKGCPDLKASVQTVLLGLMFILMAAYYFSEILTLIISGNSIQLGDKSLNLIILALLLPFFGVVVYQGYMWKRHGVELVSLYDGVLSIERKIPAWKRCRNVPIAHISSVQAVSNTRPSGFAYMMNSDFGPFMWPFHWGRVEVCYRTGRREFLRLGLQLDDGDATALASMINDHLSRNEEGS